MKGTAAKFAVAGVAALVVVAGLLVWRGAGPGLAPPGASSSSADSGLKPVTGGRLVATYRTEPSNYNRLAGDLTPDELVRLLTQDSLVRLNRATGQVEPRLARQWSRTDDGLSWTLQLREGVRFSDGTPFTAADVLFSFEAALDPALASGLAGALTIDGEPVSVRAIDDHTVIVTLPAPHGPGLSFLDGLPILPRHKLAAALEAGTLRRAWAPGTPPAEVVGLGAFVLALHRAGERLVFERNPHFWGRDEEGAPLPYLDAIELQIIPEQNAEMLQLESGAVDLVSDFVRAEDIATLRRLEAAGKLRLAEAGVSPNASGLWFNLTNKADDGRSWLRSEAFSRAVSLAVNRQAIVETVYLGQAVPIYGPVTPGFGDWHADLPATPHDPEAARALLREAGLTDTDGDGRLEDASGQPARFTILTQAGNDARTRTVSLIQSDLAAVGVEAVAQPLDVPTLIDRYSRAAYDTMYFGVDTTAADPAGLREFWLSSGGMHFWNPGQASPATDWEARIDDLFRRQMTTTDREERQRLFAEAQRVLAEHLPIIHFAAPTVTIAMRARVGGAQPSVFVPPVLWNAERLFVTSASSGAPGR